MSPLLTRIELALDRLCAAAGWLALPISLLLFLQWPLREWPGAAARQANDLAQCLFAVYVALALRHTSRLHGHLAADGLARHWSATKRAWVQRLGMALCILPTSLFALWYSLPLVSQSVLQQEAFPDSNTPGYFVIKLAMALLMAALSLQTVIEFLRPAGRPPA
nr:TRAP transporter small permease subunit [uncultured Roseateles sp.]